MGRAVGRRKMKGEKMGEKKSGRPVVCGSCECRYLGRECRGSKKMEEKNYKGKERNEEKEKREEWRVMRIHTTLFILFIRLIFI